MKTTMIRMLGFLTLAAMFSVSSAFAGTIALRLSNDGGATWSTSLDGDGDGLVTFSGAVGNWSINVSSGIGTPFASPGSLDLNSVDATTFSGDPGALLIEFSERDVSPAQPGFVMAVGGTNSNTSILYDAYYSNTNVWFAPTVAIGSLGPFAGSSFSGNGGGPTAGTVASYSLTQRMTITPTNNGTGVNHTFSGDATLDPVPEPSTLLLLGTSLAGIALARRRSKV